MAFHLLCNGLEGKIIMRILVSGKKSLSKTCCCTFVWLGVFLATILAAPNLCPAASSSTWIHSFGDGADDYYLTSNHSTFDGGLILSAVQEAWFGVPIDNAVVLKINNSGSYDWSVEARNGTYLNWVEQTSEGGYIAGGRMDSTAWILKLDSNGNSQWQWQSQFDEMTMNSIRIIHETPDGGYAMTGETYTYQTGVRRVWLARLDSQGAVLWQKALTGNGGDGIRLFQLSSDGGYFLAGSSAGTISILKIDSTGAIVWQKISTEVNQEELKSIIPTPDGGCAAYGTVNYKRTSRAWLLKLDAAGNSLWGKEFGTHSDFAADATRTLDGGYLFVGSDKTNGTWMVKTNDSGVPQWGRIITSSYLGSVESSSDGGYVISGSELSVYSYLYGPNHENAHNITKTDRFWAPEEGTSGYNILVYKLDSYGQINSCQCVHDFSIRSRRSKRTLVDATFSVQDFSINFLPAAIPLNLYTGGFAEEHLYCDDFDSKAISSNWNYPAGPWTQTGGTLKGVSTDVKTTILLDKNSDTPIAGVSADMMTAERTNGVISLLVWYQDSNNFVELEMNPKENLWSLKRFVNGTVVQHDDFSDFPIQSNQNYPVSVSAKWYNHTTDIIARFFGTYYLHITLSPTDVLTGTVGFRVKGTVGVFSSIDVIGSRFVH